MVFADDNQTATRVHDQQASGPPVLRPHRGFGWAAQVAAMPSGLGWELPGPRAAGRRTRCNALVTCRHAAVFTPMAGFDRNDRSGSRPKEARSSQESEGCG